MSEYHGLVIAPWELSLVISSRHFCFPQASRCCIPIRIIGAVATLGRDPVKDPLSGRTPPARLLSISATSVI